MLKIPSVIKFVRPVRYLGINQGDVGLVFRYVIKHMEWTSARQVDILFYEALINGKIVRALPDIFSVFSEIVE